LAVLAESENGGADPRCTEGSGIHDVEGTRDVYVWGRAVSGVGALSFKKMRGIDVSFCLVAVAAYPSANCTKDA
jgi:hypothetical protein